MLEAARKQTFICMHHTLDVISSCVCLDQDSKQLQTARLPCVMVQKEQMVSDRLSTLEVELQAAHQQAAEHKATLSAAQKKHTQQLEAAKQKSASEIMDLQERLQQESYTAQQLLKQVQTLEKSTAASQQEVVAERDALQQQLAAVHKQQLADQQELSSLMAAVAAVQEGSDALWVKLAAADGDRSQQAEAQHQLNQQLTAVRAELDAAQNAAAEASSQQTEPQQRLEQQLQAAQSDLADAQVDLQTRLAEAQLVAQQARAQAAAAEQSAEQARAQAAAAEAAAQAGVQKRDSALTRLTESFEGQRSELAELQEQLSAARQELQQERGNAAELKAQLKFAQRAEQLCAEATEQQTTLEAELAAMHQELEQTKWSSANLQSQLAAVQTANVLHAEAGSKFKDDLAVAQQERDALRAELRAEQAHHREALQSLEQGPETASQQTANSADRAAGALTDQGAHDAQDKMAAAQSELAEAKAAAASAKQEAMEARSQAEALQVHLNSNTGAHHAQEVARGRLSITTALQLSH